MKYYPCATFIIASETFESASANDDIVVLRSFPNIDKPSIYSVKVVNIFSLYLKNASLLFPCQLSFKLLLTLVILLWILSNELTILLMLVIAFENSS